MYSHLEPNNFVLNGYARHEDTAAVVWCSQFFTMYSLQQVQLSQEAIHILSLSPGSRTEEQLQTVSPREFKH